MDRAGIAKLSAELVEVALDHVEDGSSASPVGSCRTRPAIPATNLLTAAKGARHLSTSAPASPAVATDEPVTPGPAGHGGAVPKRFGTISLVESGGYATAWSMRFQHLWAVRQLLLVLAEELRSVRIEPAGPEGEGVDLIVLLPDERTEFQQCKRSFRQTGKWTLKALEAEGVLTAIGARLGTDPRASFRLVSVDAAPELRDLSEAARASLDPTSFHRAQVRASEKRTRSFEEFCRALQLDPEAPEHIAAARDLLQRTFTESVGDDEGARRELRSSARIWVEGDPGAAVAALESFAQGNLRRALTADDVERFLRYQGFQPRALARDPRTLPSIRQLQERFESSLAAQLVRGQLIHREEATRLMQLLDDAAGPRFIALHGPAGIGKSGVLLDLTRRLIDRGVPFLPIRLDRQRPGGAARQFGESLGLPESPALCLQALSGGRPAVLILDQLDALRWTGADAARAFETCRELVDECLHYPHLHVVACCRTFDLESDPQIHGWIEHGKARKVLVDRLSEQVVREIVSASGIDPQALSSSELDLLSTIQHLRAWEETVRVTGSLVQFRTGRELIDAFWSSRLLEARRMGLEPSAVQQVVDEIVEFMDRRSALLAPRRLLHGRPEVERALRSLNIIALSESDLTFCHQIYLDHQLAHLLLRRIDEGETTIEGWLTGSHQGLYRREQLRLVLGMLREERFNEYIRVVRRLHATSEVRFHLKQLMLEFLGRLPDPRGEEIEFVLSLLQDEHWQEHVAADVLYGHPRWFEAADDAGLIASWLSSAGPCRDRALRLTRSVVEQLGERCHALLAPFTEQGAPESRLAAAAMPRAPAVDSPSLFELRVKLAEEGIGWAYLDWKGLGGENLPRLVRLLPVILSSLDGRNSAPHRQGGALQGIAEVDLSEIAVSDLLAAWNALIPHAARALGLELEELEEEETADIGEHSDWRLHLRELLRRFAAELVTLDCKAVMDHADQHSNPLADLLILEVLERVDERPLADRALEWLMSKPRRLRLRWSSSDLPWEVSRRAVGQLTRHCSHDAGSSFERFLLDHRDAHLVRAMKWRHQRLLCPPEGGPRFAAWVLATPSYDGETAHHLLPAVPVDRRSEAASRRIRELQRKFADVDEIFFAGWGKVRGGSVGSPLPRDRLTSLSDRTWLGIIRNNRLARPGDRWSRQYRDDRFEESTPEAFSSDLQTATAREPGRFARLTVRFPEDGNPLYFGAVVRGLRAESLKDQPAEDTTLSELEDVLALPQVVRNDSLARDVAWLVGSRADVDWSPSTLALLAQIATEHADPAPGELRIRGGGWEDWGPESLVNNALNCTRGAATLAIARLLFADPRRLPAFAEVIDRIVGDPHPAVRAAAFDCCLATLQHEPEAAVTRALRATEGHEALLACTSFDRFLRFASGRQPVVMEATVERMLASSREDVVLVGSRHAVVLYLVHGQMEEAAVACLRGAVAQRRGAAQVAAALMDRPEHHEKARAMLLELINDDAEAVLEACAGAFRDTSLDHLAEAPVFLERYASSRAFLREPLSLLYRLHEHNGSLVPFGQCVLTICRSLADHGEDADQKQRAFWEADHYLPAILLRLYEQAPNGSGVRELCLEAWDLLLEKRVVSAVSLTKKLDAD